MRAFVKVELNQPSSIVKDKLQHYLLNIDSNVLNENSANEYLKSIRDYVKSVITTPYCEWLNILHMKGEEIYFPGLGRPAFNLEKARQSLTAEINYILYELSYYDVYADPNAIIAENRLEFTTRQKGEWLLKRLYDMRKIIDGCVPLLHLMSGNGIEFDQVNEDYAMLQDLETEGFLNSPTNFNSWCSNLSIKGKRYVEDERNRIHSSSNRKTLENEPNSMAEVLAAIEVVKQKIDYLMERDEAGKSILFDSIEDLKESIPHQTKKGAFRQLLGIFGEALLNHVIDKGISSELVKETANQFSQLLLK